MKTIFAVLLMALSVQSCQNRKSDLTTVEDVLNNPAEYLNREVSIQGIVSGVDSARQQFRIIGEKEFEECGVDKCNANEQLPVRFKEALPAIKDRVEVSGQITKTEKGFVYEAKSVRNIKDISAE